MGRRLRTTPDEYGLAFNPVHEDVHLPIVSYGACKKHYCYTVDYLGAGLCSKCWDRTGMPKKRTRKNKGSELNG